MHWFYFTLSAFNVSLYTSLGSTYQLFVFSLDSLCKCDIFLQDGCTDNRFLPALIEYTCLSGLTTSMGQLDVRSDLVITKVLLDQIVITLIMLVNGINYLMQLIPYFSWSLFSPDLLNLYIILGCGYLTFSFNPNTTVYRNFKIHYPPLHSKI